MKASFGIVLVMGLVDLPKFHNYWPCNSITSVPWFLNIMPKRRFFETLAYLHLPHNTAQLAREDPEHKLYKFG